MRGGFVYLRNRWYDPQTGRFLTQDPIGLAGGVNLYAYAGNNPIAFDDPFGLSPDCSKDLRAIAFAVCIATNAIGGITDGIKRLEGKLGAPTSNPELPVGSASTSIGQSLEVAGNKLATGIQNTGVAGSKNYTKGLPPSSGGTATVARSAGSTMLGAVGKVLGALLAIALEPVLNPEPQPANICKVEGGCLGMPVRPTQEPSSTVKRAD